MTRRRITALLVVLVLAFPIVPASASADCSVVIGMSQVRNVFQGARTLGLDTDSSFLHWSPGLVLGAWADPTSPGWTSPRFEENGRTSFSNTCQEPTHASFGFDPGTKPGQTMHQALDAVTDNIRSFYPTVETVDVWLLVGSEHGAVCPTSRGPVRSVALHAGAYDEWQAYDGGEGVTLGPDLHVECSGFRDSKGHLNSSGSATAGADWIASRG